MVHESSVLCVNIFHLLELAPALYDILTHMLNLYLCNIKQKTRITVGMIDMEHGMVAPIGGILSGLTPGHQPADIIESCSQGKPLKHKSWAAY